MKTLISSRSILRWHSEEGRKESRALGFAKAYSTFLRYALTIPRNLTLVQVVKSQIDSLLGSYLTPESMANLREMQFMPHECHEAVVLETCP